MRPLRLSLLSALALVASASFAGTSTIRLVPFPNAEVADARSQVIVSAQVLDNGRAVPDGTQVVFSTSLGSFQETVVRTTGGWARAVLVASGVPGVAKVTATLPTGDASPTVCEIEFVKDRAELSAARETIDTVSTGSLVYANDKHVLEGVALDQGVTVKYRDLEIRADVLQIDLNDFTLRAKKVTLRRGRQVQKYDALMLNLTARTGYALSNFTTTRPTGVALYPGGVAFTEEDYEENPVVARPRTRFGVVEVMRNGDYPLSRNLEGDPFEMADISDAISSIGSRQAVIFARREIQFHKANIYVDGSKLWQTPLYVINLNASSGSPLVTDELVSVNDNQIALNYPYYLSLKPGMTSLLRFRTGERYGQGLASNRGAFLDYELTWSNGDDMQGGFTFGGMGRTDWVASLRQYWRMGSRTTASFQVESPSATSIFGSGSISQGFGAFTMSLNGSQSQSFRNDPVSSQNFALAVDRNPERIAKLPLRYTYGVQTSLQRSQYDALVDGKMTTVRSERSGSGLAARFFTDSIKVDRATNLTGSLFTNKLYGPSAYGGVSVAGALSLTRRFSPSTSAFVTYNYLSDGFNDRITGMHSLSLMGNYSLGNTGLRVTMNKGLGVDRSSYYGEASYRLSNVWRLSYSIIDTQFSGNHMLDYFYVLGYRIGWREVGLTWSRQTGRIGVQLMNVNF